MIEIEYKYLVTDDSYKTLASEVHHIMQGYLSKEAERVVRVRIYDDTAFITVKGKTVKDSRLELEYEIPVDDARLMLEKLCLPSIIDKNRHIVNYKGMKWEVDEFLGNLQGLVIAEIELPSTETEYARPDFIGKNVTGDPQYYNSVLSAPRK